MKKSKILVVKVILLALTFLFSSIWGERSFASSGFFNSDAYYDNLKSSIEADDNRLTYKSFNSDISCAKADLGMGFNFGNELEWSYENKKHRRYVVRFSVGYDDTEYYRYEASVNEAGNIYELANRSNASQSFANITLTQVSGITLDDSLPINNFKITVTNNFSEALNSDVGINISYLALADINNTVLISDNSLIKEYRLHLTDGIAEVLNIPIETTVGALNSNSPLLQISAQLTDFISDYKNNPTLVYTHTYNGEVATDEELLFLKDQGFKSIRLPVTWFTHMDGTGTVDPEWFAEVNRVVNRILGYGFYVIVDIHHDTGVNGWLKADAVLFNEYETTYRYLVLQIANNFREFGDHLILEGPNEVVNYYNSKTNSQSTPISQSDYETHNRMLQVFVDEVRRTGYNNKNRFLLLNSFSAARLNLNKFVLPNDSASNKLFVGIHDYTIRSDGTLASLEYFSGDGSHYLTEYNLLMGEFGIPKTESLESRIQLMNRSVALGQQLGVPMFVWDDGGGYAIMKQNGAEWDTAYNSDQVASAMIESYNNNAMEQYRETPKAPTLSLSLDTNNPHMIVSPSTFSSTSQTITSSTTNFTGYVLTISSYGGTTDLVHADNNTLTIPTITLPSGKNSIHSSEFDTGYGYSTDATNYRPLPVENEVLLSTSSANSSDDITVLTFGALVDQGYLAGDYKQTFLITMVANDIGYLISYYPNAEGDVVSGMPSPNPIQGSSDTDSINLSESVPTRNGYVFLGWSKLADSAEAEYQPGSSLSLDYEDDNYIDLYAVWEKACTAQSICYDANGAESGSMGEQGVTSNTTAILLPSNYSHSGYGFAGWNTKADGSGTYYGPNQKITLGDLSTVGLTLYATWVPTENDITMQTFNPVAYSDKPVNAVFALRDERDNNVYSIARLADGNFWMIENLRHEESAYITDNTTQPAVSPNTRAQNFYGYGNYYQGSSVGDTCPTGWHVPTGGPSGEFASLSIALGGINGKMNQNTTPSGSSISAIFRSYPNNFLLSGRYNTAISEQGEIGYYYSSTRSGTTSYYVFQFGTGYVYPGTASVNGTQGRSIRCVASGKAIHRLVYHGNNSDDDTAMSSLSYYITPTDNDLVLYPSNYSKNGYGYIGWNTAADGTGTAFGPNENITASEVRRLADNDGILHLYAQWIESTGTMQEWTGCDLMSEGDVTALSDTRDNETYAIAKLGDGKCWMIENLRTIPDAGTTFTAENTNNPSNDFLTQYSSASSSDQWCTADVAACYNQIKYNSDNVLHRDSNLLRSAENNIYSYGVYYNWYTATAGNGTYESTINSIVSGDICPSGWHLPRGAMGTNDFTALNSAVNSGATNSSAGLRVYPNNYIQSGFYYDSSWVENGWGARYWTTDPASNTVVYRLYFGKKSLNTTESVKKNRGYTLRCISN